MTDFFKIDGIDEDLSSAYNWRQHGGYARWQIRWTSEGKKNRKWVHLHREILGRVVGRPLLASEIADHVNGDKLDNRRGNLRLATCAENARNTSKRWDNTSGYLGVTWNKSNASWYTKVRVNGVDRHIGYFRNKVVAAVARDKLAIELHGDFVRLNFDRKELDSVL